VGVCSIAKAGTFHVNKTLGFLIGHFHSLLDELRGSYWPIPVFMTLGAGTLALAMIQVEDIFSPQYQGLFAWMVLGDQEGALAVMSVIAGSMATIAGVVFSINLVALTLASAQFGPRLLRNFMRDRVNQIAFGAFTGVFLYSLIVLMAIAPDRVPKLACAIAVLLAVMALFMLIYFIHHTVTSIQVSGLTEGISREIGIQLKCLFPEAIGEAPPEAAPADVIVLQETLRAEGVDLTSRARGFLRVIDHKALMATMERLDSQIELLVAPGTFVGVGYTLARVAPRGRMSQENLDELRSLFVVGAQRSAVQDLGFLIDQLTEIAVKALSPGINDPETAVTCAQHLGALIAAAASRDMPTGARVDDAGRVRVLAPTMTFDDLVATCLDPIRRYGCGHAAVVLALCDVLTRCAPSCAAAHRRHTLFTHLRHLRSAWKRVGADRDRDDDLVDSAFAHAEAALA